MEEPKVEKFTYLRNLYELIKYLPSKNRLELSDAINDYMFENIEPTLEGLSYGVWINIKRMLDGYKNRVKNGKKGGAPVGNSNAKNTTEKQPSIQPKNNLTYNQKTTKKQPNIQPDIQPKNNKNNILYFYNFIFSNFNFKDNINNLLKEYLELRIKKKYTLSETIVTRLCNKLLEYGKTDEEKKEIILNAINGSWKDFYPLKEGKNSNGVNKQPIPKWFDKKYEKEELTDEQKRELEQIKNGTFKA